MKQYKLGILGATGAVGREMMKILAERKFPISELHLFASKRSAGKVIEWQGKPVQIEEACETAFEGPDIVLGAAEADIAKEMAPYIVKAGAVFVDNSSAFRLERDVPLIEASCDAVPSLRIRLGSLEPRIVTEEFCAALGKLPNLCPQFHLSMQSGCDTVLQRMRRKYDTARYLESLELLRKYFPGCAVTTDMIVAFPGETEEEFRQSLEFIRKCGFAEMHVFPYSRRPGTPAAQMPGQLGNAVKEQRSREAIAVAREMNRSFREALVGSVQEVLFEEAEGSLSTGHARNYIRVWAEGTGLHNEIRSVKITALYQDGLLGEILGA